MLLKVITQENSKHLKDLKVGELILCEGNIFLPIKSIVVISGYPIFYRTSSNLAFHISKRMKLKTEKGFKIPELWDTLITTNDITPMITTVKTDGDLMFFYDILIDGNIVTPDGLIFRYD